MCECRCAGMWLSTCHLPSQVFCCVKDALSSNNENICSFETPVCAVRDDAGAVRGGGGGLVLPSSGPEAGGLPL